jgi:hypothetical protein
MRNQGHASFTSSPGLEESMSLPSFSAQAELFSTAGLSSSLFNETDRYRIFAQTFIPGTG